MYPTETNDKMPDTLEAFFAVERRGALGPVWYRAGYRCGEPGHTVCKLELPASIVEPAVLREAKLAATVTPDGCVRFSVWRVASEDISEGLPSIAEPIDQLIARTVAVDNLHLEEFTSADLDSLLQRLLRSVALVQRTIENLSNQHLQSPK